MRSLLAKHPWLSSLFGLHAALFMADPCGGGGDSGAVAPGPTASTAPIPTVSPPPPASPYSVYHARGPSEPVVDPAVTGGESADVSICNYYGGDVLLGAGWKLADTSVDVRSIGIEPDATTYVMNGGVLRAATGVAGAHAFRVSTTCLHKEGGQASLDISTTTTAQLPAVSPAGKSATAVSSCGPGNWLVGGGLSVEAPLDGTARAYPRVTRLGPQDNAWVMRARSSVGTSTFSTTAVCARAKTEILYPYPTTTFSVAPGASAEGTLGCPDGYAVYSGGFAMDDDAKVAVLENRPTPDLASGVRKGPTTGWFVGVKSADTVPRTITVTVLCGKNGEAMKAAPAFTPPSSESPAADPKIAVAPNPVTAYCANASWPNKLTVKNEGGGNLAWSVTQPAGTPNLIVSPMSGLLGAGATQTVTLGGQVADKPSFVLPFAGNGGAVDVTVQCQ